MSRRELAERVVLEARFPATMDDDGGLGIRSWAYYDQPRGNLGLQLMSSVPSERDVKPFLSNGGFLHRSCNIPEPPVPPEFVRDNWFSHRDNNKFLHMLPMNYNFTAIPGGTAPAPAPAAHTFQMLQHHDDPPEEDKPVLINEPVGDGKDVPLKKRNQGPRAIKPPKQKKPKKAGTPSDESSICLASRGRSRTVMKSTAIVINGIDLDISGIPTPVCSCTGSPQQCYRWGVGGWQSACCTTNLSEYPLPMSTKRRGARIAGRKMSQGAFKKVLEKITGEGYNLSNPIDLRAFWAKHGTNKFVTIR